MVWELFNDADLFLRHMSKAMVGLLLCGALCAVSFFFLGYCAHLTNTEALTPSWCPVAMFANGVKMKHKNNRSCTLVFILFYSLLLLKYINCSWNSSYHRVKDSFLFIICMVLQLSKSITSTMNIVSPTFGREAADKKTEEEAVKSQNDLKILGNSGWIPPLFWLLNVRMLWKMSTGFRAIWTDIGSFGRC